MSDEKMEKPRAFILNKKEAMKLKIEPQNESNSERHVRLMKSILSWEVPSIPSTVLRRFMKANNLKQKDIFDLLGEVDVTYDEVAVKSWIRSADPDKHSAPFNISIVLALVHAQYFRMQERKAVGKGFLNNAEKKGEIFVGITDLARNILSKVERVHHQGLSNEDTSWFLLELVVLLIPTLSASDEASDFDLISGNLAAMLTKQYRSVKGITLN